MKVMMGRLAFALLLLAWTDAAAQAAPPPPVALPPAAPPKLANCRSPEGLIVGCRIAEDHVGPESAYPERALDDEVEGIAVVSCIISDAVGTLKCDPVAEEPYGYGFAKAAAKMATRHYHLISPDGADLTGFGHSITVPFLFNYKPDLAIWRDFPLASELKALPGADTSNRLPPLNSDGFEVAAEQVKVSCVTAEDDDHALCNLVSESDPSLHLGEGVVAKLNALARLKSVPGRTATTTVIFPYPGLHYTAEVSDFEIRDAYSQHDAGRPPVPASAFVTLRCTVIDVVGHLKCTTFSEQFPASGRGEIVKKLYEDKARVTVDGDSPLVGRVLRVDIWMPF